MTDETLACPLGGGGEYVFCLRRRRIFDDQKGKVQ